MNEMNLETSLKSWTPRPPSAELRGKVFGVRPAASAAATPAVLPEELASWLDQALARAGWLTSALACGMGLLLLLGLVAPGTAQARTAENVSLLAFSGSNIEWNQVQHFTLPAVLGDEGLQRQILAQATLGWTNQPSSPSSNGSFLPARTNL